MTRCANKTKTTRLFRVLNWWSSEQPHPCCSLTLGSPPPSLVVGSSIGFFPTKLIRSLTPDKLLGYFLHELIDCTAQRSFTKLPAWSIPLPHLGVPPAVRGSVLCPVDGMWLAGQEAARCLRRHARPRCQWRYVPPFFAGKQLLGPANRVLWISKFLFIEIHGFFFWWKLFWQKADH